MKSVFGKFGLSIAFFLGFAQVVFSQDVIVVLGGTEIKVKVIGAFGLCLYSS